MAYILALLAALANAASSVLQRKANREQPRRDSLNWRLIADLVHEPVWFAGIATVFAGFLLQAAALGLSGLATVQPILVLELPATLLLSAKVFSSHLGRREWLPIVAMTGALAALLYFLRPGAGNPDVPLFRWLAGSGITVALIACLVILSRHAPAGTSDQPAGSTRRAAVLGIAAGAGFGLTSAYMKGMTNSFAHGIVALIGSWQLYAMIAAGGAAMFLLQSAFNAGRLIAAQPGVTLTDPIVATLWGILIFHESFNGGWHLVLAILAATLMLVAVLLLVRSPVFDR